MRIGIGYAGSNDLVTSTAEQELVPANVGAADRAFYAFSFYNEDECTVKINGGDAIFLGEGQGFNTTEVDAPINSFVVVEAGVKFNWIGGY